MWDLVGNPEDRFSHNEAYFLDSFLRNKANLFTCSNFLVSEQSTIHQKGYGHGLIKAFLEIFYMLLYALLLASWDRDGE